MVKKPKVKKKKAEVKEKYIPEQKWVKEKIVLEDRGFFGEELQIVDDSFFDEIPTKKKLAPRLHKYWNKGGGKWGNSSYKIKNYERWLQIKELLETKIFPKIGWAKLSKFSKDLFNEKKAKKEINNKLQLMVEQNPSLANDFLEKLNVGNLSKENINFAIDLINNLDKKLLESDKIIKETFKSVISNLSKSKGKGLSELDNLLKEWNLLEMASLSSILCRRIRTLELLEEMITKEETYELKGDNSIHRILERNMWILDENYWLIQSNKSLRTFIGEKIIKKDKDKSKKRPDFVCCDGENKLIIVEIKRPSLVLDKKGIDQIEQYTLIAEDYKSKEFKTTDAILVGNSINQNGRKLIKKRMGIKFMTYNELIEKVKTKYTEYFKKLEELRNAELI